MSDHARQAAERIAKRCGIGHPSGSSGAIRSIIQQAISAETSELRAIVERLPTLADGGKAVPLGRVFLVEGNGHITAWVVASMSTLNDREWALLLTDGEDKRAEYPRNCYSTRAAAEAAQAEKGQSDAKVQ